MTIKEIEERKPQGQIELPDSIDKSTLKDIMVYRALGYNQTEIAEEIDVSQKTVSRYLNQVNELAAEYENPESVFYGIFISMFADELTEIMTMFIDFSKKSKKEENQ